MKRRAFLAALVGTPLAAKIPFVPSGVARLAFLKPSPEDLSFLNSQRYEAVEIARLFRVDPSMIAGIESNGHLMEMERREYVEHVLTPCRNRVATQGVRHESTRVRRNRPHH